MKRRDIEKERVHIKTLPLLHKDLTFDFQRVFLVSASFEKTKYFSEKLIHRFGFNFQICLEASKKQSGGSLFVFLVLFFIIFS